MSRRFVFALCALTLLAFGTSSAAVAAEQEPAERDEARDESRRHHHGWFDRLRGFGDPAHLGRGRLGVQIQPLTPELRAFFGGPEDRGVLVARVETDSPAARAGLRVGDVIIAAAGDGVERMHDLIRAVHHAKAGEPVALELVRDRETLTVEVTPDAPDIARHECDAEDCPHGRPFGLPFPHGGRELGERLDEIEKRLDELEQRVLPGMEGAERAT